MGLTVIDSVNERDVGEVKINCKRNINNDSEQ
jgi:hypothetical protein